MGRVRSIERFVRELQNRVKIRCPEGRKPLGFGGFFMSVSTPIDVARKHVATALGHNVSFVGFSERNWLRYRRMKRSFWPRSAPSRRAT
jgi:hypothetical protein